jgi:DNA invertase Pin-like site-specific DNA recombinase
MVCEPFVDDGYSGVSFNRPSFKKLEDAIRKGGIDCIVVKDLSRFSRNYIDGGRYLEKIFPQLGIRFIAVNDAYDSLTGDPQSDSFVIPFKNLINDSYCKDISMKIRSSLEVKQKNGEFVGAFAPYGYKKSPENKNQLIVDEAVSEYVQMIFAMYKDGFSIGRIADRLNQMGVLSPMEYKHSAGVKFDTVFKTGDIAKWTYKAVQRILTNEVYIGVLAQGKRGTPNYKVRVVQSKDEAEWVKVENAHEALVSYEDFMAVKTMMKRDMRCSPDQNEAHLFSGFLFCGDCQQSMIRKTVPSKTKKYIYYVCSSNKHSRTCSPHSISAKEVEEKVFRAIHDQIELVINLERALELIERLPSQSRKAFNYEAQITKLEEEIERYQKLKLRLYEDLSDHSNHDRDTECRVGEKYSESRLEDIVYNAIGDFLAFTEKQAVQNREVGDIRKTAIKDCAAKLKALQTQTDQLKNGKLRLYEKYTSGSISKAEYLKQKTAFDEKLAENAEAIQKAHERMQELDSECSCSDERVNQVCEQYRNQTALTFELTHAFIKAIYVHDADNIEILWKFRDIYEETEGKV